MNAESNNLPPFEPREDFERLLELRARDPEAFILQTSEATRNALAHYERWRASAQKASAREAGEVES